MQHDQRPREVFDQRHAEVGTPDGVFPHCNPIKTNGFHDVATFCLAQAQRTHNRPTRGLTQIDDMKS